MRLPPTSLLTEPKGRIGLNHRTSTSRTFGTIFSCFFNLDLMGKGYYSYYEDGKTEPLRSWVSCSNLLSAPTSMEEKGAGTDFPQKQRSWVSAFKTPRTPIVLGVPCLLSNSLSPVVWHLGGGRAQSPQPLCPEGCQSKCHSSWFSGVSRTPLPVWEQTVKLCIFHKAGPSQSIPPTSMTARPRANPSFSSAKAFSHPQGGIRPPHSFGAVLGHLEVSGTENSFLEILPYWTLIPESKPSL